jgi:hypothetical protein
MTSVVDRHRFYAEPDPKNVGKAEFFLLLVTLVPVNILLFYLSRQCHSVGVIIFNIYKFWTEH